MSGLINLSLRHCMELRRRIGLLCTMGGRESAEKTAGREKRDAKCRVVAVRYRRRDRWRRRSSASRCSLSQLPASLWLLPVSASLSHFLSGPVLKQVFSSATAEARDH